jgi:hypothetical protein
VSSYRVTVTDRLLPALTGQAGSHYESPPQPEQQARALARVLLDLPASPTGQGPWRRAHAGGSRTVALHALPERTQR